MIISDFAIKRPMITVVTMVALVVFGLFALWRLQTDEFPDIQQPVVAEHRKSGRLVVKHPMGRRPVVLFDLFARHAGVDPGKAVAGITRRLGAGAERWQEQG